MTTIAINRILLEKAMQLSGTENEKAVVEKALKLLISIRQQAKLRKLRGKLKWEGNLNEMRTDQ